MAEYLHIHPKNPDERKIRQVVDAMRNGALVIYPTDTLYAIGCDILAPKTIERLARIKKVEAAKANFSIMCADLSHISEYAHRIDQSVFRLMKKALPGPYTFILEATGEVPKLLSNKKKTIGIRIPDNRICCELIEKLGRPIITSSLHADDAIQEYPTDPDEINDRFSKLVDIIIDGGPGGLIPSTIFNCANGEIEIMREGAGSLDILN